MKKSAKALVTAALAVVLSVGSFAAGSLIDISVDPTVRVMVNGTEFKPTDANGNPVMLFSYNGTTYAPLRALAEAYGLEVGYDAAAKMATVSQPATNPAENTYAAPAQSDSLEGIAFFWAPTGDKVHMDPNCRSFKTWYTFAGTLEEVRTVRTKGWCGYCAQDANGSTTTNPMATAAVLEKCYSYNDYINGIPADAFN